YALRHLGAGLGGRHRTNLGVAAGQGGRAQITGRSHGRIDAGQRRWRGTRAASVGGRCVQRCRGRARPQGSREITLLCRGGAAGGSVMKAPLRGRFGSYGGQYIPETLMAAVDELAAAFDTAGT